MAEIVYRQNPQIEKVILEDDIEHIRELEKNAVDLVAETKEGKKVFVQVKTLPDFILEKIDQKIIIFKNAQQLTDFIFTHFAHNEDQVEDYITTQQRLMDYAEGLDSDWEWVFIHPSYLRSIEKKQ